MEGKPSLIIVHGGWLAIRSSLTDAGERRVVTQTGIEPLQTKGVSCGGLLAKCRQVASKMPEFRSATPETFTQSVPRSGPQKIQGNLLHNLLHDPGLWRLARGIISNSLVLTR